MYKTINETRTNKKVLTQSLNGRKNVKNYFHQKGGAVPARNPEIANMFFGYSKYASKEHDAHTRKKTEDAAPPLVAKQDTSPAATKRPAASPPPEPGVAALRKRCPRDDIAKTRKQFVETFGGTTEWDGAHVWVDRGAGQWQWVDEVGAASDPSRRHAVLTMVGGPGMGVGKTRKEFIERYGGTKEWDDARPWIPGKYEWIADSYWREDDSDSSSSSDGCDCDCGDVDCGRGCGCDADAHARLLPAGTAWADRSAMYRAAWEKAAAAEADAKADAKADAAASGQGTSLPYFSRSDDSGGFGAQRQRLEEAARVLAPPQQPQGARRLDNFAVAMRPSASLVTQQQSHVGVGNGWGNYQPQLTDAQLLAKSLEKPGGFGATWVPNHSGGALRKKKKTLGLPKQVKAGMSFGSSLGTSAYSMLTLPPHMGGKLVPVESEQGRKYIHDLIDYLAARCNPRERELRS